MIAKVMRYGSDAPGLMAYLHGPGTSNEHTNPHIIASTGAGFLREGEWWSGDFAAEHHGANLTTHEARDVGHLLQADWAEHRDDARALVAAAEVGAPVQPALPLGGRLEESPQEVEGIFRVESPWSPEGVWDGPRSDESPSISTGLHRKHIFHATLSLSADEGQLTDKQWGIIANEYVRGMGLAGQDNRADVQWTAVRHGLSTGGNDHIHIVASMVGSDGRWWNDHQSLRRSRQVADQIEKRHGLRPVRDTTQEHGQRARTQAEYRRAGERTAEHGAAHTETDELEARMRAASARAGTEAGYVGALLQQGVRVRPRFERGSTTNVVGYNVALREAGDRPTWYGGRRIARDLSLRALREQWAPNETAETRDAALRLWRRGAGVRNEKPAAATPRDAQAARDTITRYAQWTGTLNPADRETWQRVARDMSGVYAQWATAPTLSPEHRHGYARAAREMAAVGGRGHGGQLRHAARTAHLMLRSGSSSDVVSTMAMLRQMQRTIAALREAQLARQERVAAQRIGRAAGPNLRDAVTSHTERAGRASVERGGRQAAPQTTTRGSALTRHDYKER